MTNNCRRNPAAPTVSPRYVTFGGLGYTWPQSWPLLKFHPAQLFPTVAEAKQCKHGGYMIYHHMYSAKKDRQGAAQFNRTFLLMWNRVSHTVFPLLPFHARVTWAYTSYIYIRACRVRHFSHSLEVWVSS